MPYVISRDCCHGNYVNEGMIQNCRPRCRGDIVVYDENVSPRHRHKRRRKRRNTKEYITGINLPTWEEIVVVEEILPPKNRNRYRVSSQDFYIDDGGRYYTGGNGFASERGRYSRQGSRKYYQENISSHRSREWNLPQPPIDNVGSYHAGYNDDESGRVISVIGQHPLKPSQGKARWEMIADYPDLVERTEGDQDSHTFNDYNRESRSYFTDDRSDHASPTQQRAITKDTFTTTEEYKTYEYSPGDNLEINNNNFYYSNSNNKKRVGFSSSPKEYDKIQGDFNENVNNSSILFQGSENVSFNDDKETYSKVYKDYTTGNRRSKQQNSSVQPYALEETVTISSEKETFSSNPVIVFDAMPTQTKDNTNNQPKTDKKKVREKKIISKRHHNEELKKWNNLYKQDNSSKSRMTKQHQQQQVISQNENDLKQWMSDKRNTKASSELTNIPAERVTVNGIVTPPPASSKRGTVLRTEDDTVEMTHKEEILPSEAFCTGHLDIKRKGFWDRFSDDAHKKNKDGENKNRSTGEKDESCMVMETLQLIDDNIQKAITDCVNDVKESPWGRHIASLGRKETCEELKKRVRHETIFVTPTYSNIERPSNKDLNLDKLDQCGCSRPLFLSSCFENRSILPAEQRQNKLQLLSDNGDDNVLVGGSYLRMYCDGCNGWETESCCGDTKEYEKNKK